MREVNEAEEQEILLRKRRQKRILALVALGVAVFSLYGWWRKTTEPEPVILAAGTESGSPARKAGEMLVLYVSGMVEQPGVVRLPEGARVIDAINAAGGVLPGSELSKVNLAQKLRDGMQVHVPSGTASGETAGTGRAAGGTQRGQSGGGGTAPAEAAAPAAVKININTADASELDKLPGVGPAMAAKIVEWRNSHGPFSDGEDLKKIRGIGDAKFQTLKDRITW